MSGIYNASDPNGGDSLTNSADIDALYTPGDMAWILFASALVWLMIPGIGYKCLRGLIDLLGSSTEDWVDERALWLSSGKVYWSFR
jgi:hypothetical protein